MNKKFIVTGALCVVTTLALTGCGSQPKNAAELIEKSSTLSNCDFNGSANLGIYMNMGGFEMDMPISISGSGSIADKSIHANMDLTMEVFGESSTAKEEMYVDYSTTPAMAYSNTTSDGQESGWISAEIQDADLSFLDQKFDKSKFQDAEFVYNKDAKSYTVTAKLSALMDEKTLSEGFASAGDELAAYGVTEETIKQLLNDNSVVLTYDEACNLTNITVPAFSYEYQYEEEGMETTMKLTVDMNANFSNHGKASGTKVSDEIKNSAVSE